MLYLSLAKAEVTLIIGNGSGIPGSHNNPVEVNLDNPDDKVSGILVDVCDIDDYLSCTECETTERTSGFKCVCYEQKNGCAGVVVFSLICDLIEEGEGPIVTIKYDISEEAPIGECRDLNPENVIVSDIFGGALPVYTASGEFCFIACGDVYPVEFPPDDPICGDDVVNLFDVLEEMDFVLEIVEPSTCQRIRADVSTGTPPYCSDPDGEIDIYDVLVIIDKALGKLNCCDYYYSSAI